MKDNFPSSDAVGSAIDGFAVTPDDANDLVQRPRALWVGTGGNVAVTFPSGNVTLTNVPNGTVLPIRPSRVRATATTALNIVALI